MSEDCSLPCLCRICVGCEDDFCSDCNKNLDDIMMYCSEFRKKTDVSEQLLTEIEQAIQETLHRTPTTEDKEVAGLPEVGVYRVGRCEFAG